MLGQQNVGQRVDSLFIGGGTPTVLPWTMLTGIVRAVKESFTVDDQAEITVEANPGTIDEHYLTELKKAGVSRLSLGVQSFRQEDLVVLGRIHSGIEAKMAFAAAKRAGFTNINLDLMYGLPGQTSRDWQDTLLQALALQPRHLSAYQLTLEDQTPLRKAVDEGVLAMPPEDEVVAMDEATEQLCLGAGLVHYEISNFADEGYQCRHNVNYWQNGEYFACGAASVSYVQGRRERRIANPLGYSERLSQGVTPIVEVEELSREASFRETVVMGLRLTEGLDRESLRYRFGLEIEGYYGEVLQKLQRQGLIEMTATNLRLSKRGRRFANIVLAELV